MREGPKCTSHHSRDIATEVTYCKWEHEYVITLGDINKWANVARLNLDMLVSHQFHCNLASASSWGFEMTCETKKNRRSTQIRTHIVESWTLWLPNYSKTWPLKCYKYCYIIIIWYQYMYIYIYVHTSIKISTFWS